MLILVIIVAIPVTLGAVLAVWVPALAPAPPLFAFLAIIIVMISLVIIMAVVAYVLIMAVVFAVPFCRAEGEEPHDEQQPFCHV